MILSQKKTLRLLLSLIPFCFLLLSNGIAFGTVWYVDGNVERSGRGTSWGQPFKTVQEAVDVVDADMEDEIWVKQGGQIGIYNAYGTYIGTEANQTDRHSDMTTIDNETPSLRAFDISYLQDLGISNLLGLAVNPENGNVFLTSLSYGGQDNLWEFSPEGHLLSSTRATIETGPTGNLGSIVVGREGHLFTYVAKDIGAGNYERFIVEMSQDGNTVFSTFSAEQYTRGGDGITYNPLDGTLFILSFRDKKVYETNIDGELIDSFDVYPYGYGPIDMAFDPFSLNIYIIYELWPTPAKILFEYSETSSSGYALINAYDLGSAGITEHILALDIDRTTGQFWVQENNERVVEFNKEDLGTYPVIFREGTIGTEFIITCSDFGSEGRKVYIGNNKCKVLEWKDTSIYCVLKDMRGFMSPGSYDVTIKPKEADPIVMEQAFTIEEPQIPSSHGRPGDEITIEGRFFGTKKGKLYLGDRRCKIRGWTMEPTSGRSEIVFLVPIDLSPGDYDLTVENKVGSDTSTFHYIDYID
ncbi:MAG: IPT/TIG domain-containing protein [Candidatus Hodarchaeota archaeon]